MTFSKPENHHNASNQASLNLLLVVTGLSGQPNTHNEAVNGSVLCLLSLLGESRTESITMPISNPFPFPFVSGVSLLMKRGIAVCERAVMCGCLSFMWMLCHSPVRSVIGGQQ